MPIATDEKKSTASRDSAQLFSVRALCSWASNAGLQKSGEAHRSNTTNQWWPLFCILVTYQIIGRC